MKNISRRDRLSPWILVAAILAVGVSVFVQYSHPASAATASTLYPSAASATLTPDTLLW